MDADFHYYGTATAAFHSGFAHDDAKEIAFAAQFLDWFNNDYSDDWQMVNRKGEPLSDPQTNEPYYFRPQLCIQSFAVAFLKYDVDIWNAFHFPPGNFEYETITGQRWETSFRKQLRLRDTKFSEGRDRLCRPYSQFARDLILDTVEQYQALFNAKGQKLKSLIDKLIGRRSRLPVSDGEKLARYLLGIRMHVLGDTWAHQDFTGEPSVECNSVVDREKVSYRDPKTKKQIIVEWSGPPLGPLNKDTDCAAPPDVTWLGDRSSPGHSQMGYLPDYSWLTFRYLPAWKSDNRSLTRNNPKEYSKAWSWMSFVMGLCNGSIQPNKLPSKPPLAIQQVIAKWRRLSPKKNKAILASEKHWETAKNLKKYLPRDILLPKTEETNNYWKEINDNRTKRKDLGLWKGRAWTPFGELKVMKESSLHYMELAATMHYQFCYAWAKTNQDKVTWIPGAPK